VVDRLYSISRKQGKLRVSVGEVSLICLISITGLHSAVILILVIVVIKVS